MVRSPQGVLLGVVPAGAGVMGDIHFVIDAVVGHAEPADVEGVPGEVVGAALDPHVPLVLVVQPGKGGGTPLRVGVSQAAGQPGGHPVPVVTSGQGVGRPFRRRVAHARGSGGSGAEAEVRPGVSGVVSGGQARPDDVQDSALAQVDPFILNLVVAATPTAASSSDGDVHFLLRRVVGEGDGDVGPLDPVNATATACIGAAVLAVADPSLGFGLFSQQSQFTHCSAPS